MMVAEIGGGALFGSMALIADGLHMSTHAGALLIAALAYTYARRFARDDRFTFGTGKLGDLAAFTSAIALAMIVMFFVGWPVPKVAIAPIIVIWFGYGMSSKVIITATIAFFPVLANTIGEGLMPGAEVKFHGLAIGTVKTLESTGYNRQRMTVEPPLRLFRDIVYIEREIS